MFYLGDLVWIKEREVSSFQGWGLVVGVKKTVLKDGSSMVDLVVFGTYYPIQQYVCWQIV